MAILSGRFAQECKSEPLPEPATVVYASGEIREAAVYAFDLKPKNGPTIPHVAAAAVVENDYDIHKRKLLSHN